MWRKFNSMSMLKTHAPAIFLAIDAFSTVHTNKIYMRLRFDPFSRAFSNRCDFDQNPQRIGACGQKAWTHRNICLFDGALHYISSVFGQTEKNSKLWVDKSPVRARYKTKAQLTEILTTSRIRVGLTSSTQNMSHLVFFLSLLTAWSNKTN